MVKNLSWQEDNFFTITVDYDPALARLLEKCGKRLDSL